MAIFTNKIVSTRFIDPPNNILIEVLYTEGDKIVPYTLDVDFTSEDFNDLLQEVTLDDIEEETNKQLVSEKDAFYAIVEAEIERRWATESKKIKKEYDKVYQDADQYIEGKQEDARASLKALQEGFTNSGSKELKITGKKIVEMIQATDDKDFIFDMKVAILEDPDVVKSKDKTMKMSIRKAKTTMELLKIYTSQKV